MSSIFTAPGTNQRDQQNQQYLNVGSDASSLLAQLMPLLQQQQGFAAGLEPQRQSLINQFLQTLNPSNYNSMAQTVGNQAMSQAQDRARYAGGMFGANSGAAKGAWNQGLNSATSARNTYLANLWNPQNRQQQLGAGIGMIGSSATPGLQNFGQLASTVYGQPQIPVGKGFGDILGGLAGSFLGGGVGNPFSSGGSSGGGGGFNGSFNSNPRSWTNF